MKHQRLSIRKTKGEWDIIGRVVSEKNKKDLGCFLRSEIIRLVKEFEECPDCITIAKGNPKTKRPYIFIHQLKELEPIAKKMKVDVSTVIDRLIIAPLLMPD